MDKKLTEAVQQLLIN